MAVGPSLPARHAIASQKIRGNDGKSRRWRHADRANIRGYDGGSRFLTTLAKLPRRNQGDGRPPEAQKDTETQRESELRTGLGR